MHLSIRNISAAYRFVRLMSIDVALGGVVFSNSIAFVLGIIIPYSVSLSLFIAIWLIYTVDHLMDARKTVYEPSMIRHQFHGKHRKGILFLSLLVLLIGFFTLFFVPIITVIYGLIISVIVIIYFFLSWKMNVFLIKEVLIASVYATGICLGPASLGQIKLETLFCLLIQVFGIALINLLIFTYYEIKLDTADGQHSWAVRFGMEKTKFHINIGIVVLLAFQIFCIVFVTKILWLQLILIGMTIVLFLIFRNENVFKVNERYRSFGDLIFFMPGILFWF